MWEAPHKLSGGTRISSFFFSLFFLPVSVCQEAGAKQFLVFCSDLQSVVVTKLNSQTVHHPLKSPFRQNSLSCVFLAEVEVSSGDVRRETSKSSF